jgi:hypothetical protein
MHWHIGKWFFPRRFLLRATLGAMLLAAAATASAEGMYEQDKPGKYANWELTPFYGYMFGGQFEDPATNTDRDVNEDNNIGIFIDAAADQWRHYELIYSKQATSVDGAPKMDLDVEYLQIGGTVMYQDAETVIPYFGMTIGAARLSPSGPGLDDETKFAFSVGGGFKVPVTDHIGVRFDARAFLTLLDSSGNVFCVSDNGAGTCAIRTKSDTFVQYQAALGVIIGF